MANDTHFPGTAFPVEGFYQSYTVGNPNNYTTYDTYGFDQYELTMGIRIKALTGLNPTRDDADYCLTTIRDDSLTLIEQNALITNYMNNKYVPVS